MGQKPQKISYCLWEYPASTGRRLAPEKQGSALGGGWSLDHRLLAPTQFILDHQAMVFNLAYRILGDPEMAVAATEETFLRASLALPKSGRKSPRLWLMQTAVAVCKELLYRAPHQDPHPGECWPATLAHQASPAPTAPQPSREDGQALLNALSPDQRVVLVLSDLQGLSYREIAEVTGVSVQVIRTCLSQARAALRDALFARGEMSPGVQP
jgi:RNA polymerase sigma-70 factor (ECF subfamily)